MFYVPWRSYMNIVTNYIYYLNKKQVILFLNIDTYTNTILKWILNK